jgi:hypothetical protein
MTEDYKGAVLSCYAPTFRKQGEYVAPYKTPEEIKKWEEENRYPKIKPALDRYDVVITHNCGGEVKLEG